MEKKIKESEVEKRRSGKAESFPSVLLIDGLIDFTDLDSSLYTAQSKGSYKKKKTKTKSYYKG